MQPWFFSQISRLILKNNKSIHRHVGIRLKAFGVQNPNMVMILNNVDIFYKIVSLLTMSSAAAIGKDRVNYSPMATIKLASMCLAMYRNGILV